MAQVNALVAGLSTRDSSLQISSCPKQEDLAVPDLLSDRKNVGDADLSVSYLQTAPDRCRLCESKDHQALEFTFKIRR